MAKRPSAPAWRSDSGPPQKYQKGNQQQQKGKAKGKGKKGPAGGHCASHTPAGDMICYRFNSGEKCKAAKCKFKHVCGLCFSDKHALPECTGKTRQDPPRDTQGAGAHWQVLRVLYVFSGRRRKNSLGAQLRKLSALHGITIEVVELDIQRNRKDDFSLPGVQKRWLQRISAGEFFAVIVTPPCSTFSRAVWANDQGPFPVRSAVHPRGFPWNCHGRQVKAELGNILADFSFEAMRRQAAFPGRVGIMEQPEDLGRTARPRIPGHRPASMWQFLQFWAALQEGLKTVALAQLDFGSLSVKPTRLLLHLSQEPHPAMHGGPPVFSEDAMYLGPLPRRTGEPLIGRKDGAFKTTEAAAWPPGLCRWAADTIIAAYQQYRVNGRSNDKQKDKQDLEKEGETEEPHVDPMNPLVAGGLGPPRCCVWKGEKRPFHDGGGLSSPGRWPKKMRKYPQGEEWKSVRTELMELVESVAGGKGALEKEFFRMTKGGVHFSLVKNEELLGSVRSPLVRQLGLSAEALRVPEGQPFFLGLLREVLRAAGDCDHEFLKKAEEGLPLGILEPLPRTPEVFEKQVKWALDDDPGAVWSLSKGNYVSAVQHVDHLRRHLEEEVQMGLVDKMEERLFEEEYGGNRAVAALAVLVEDEVSGKKRVIHDGTHGIGVNNRVRCRDKVRMPGPREKREVLEELEESREVVMALVGDFEKAHRRFLYQKSERGYLACKVREEDSFVYINKVGTFGIGSTPYWWARISACLMRVAHYLLGEQFWVELLLYADDLEVVAPGRTGRCGAMLTFLYMAAFGAPFKWAKQRGGWITEWVGLCTDYKRFAMGLSEGRAAWLCNWMRSVEERKEITDAEFAAGLGRLGFAALALPWERPMLGPLFSWSAAVRGEKGSLRLPWVVLMVMRWIRNKLESGLRMQDVKKVAEEKRPAIKIWTDAKATEQGAWIGGWVQDHDDPLRCRWFSEKVDERLAPWLFVKGGNPKRVIAALELLGTLVAIKLWGCEKDIGGVHLRTEAFTDNRGNEFILKRGLSTKFPLTLLLIEVCETLRETGSTASLQWVRRDENQLADDLTNEEFGKFNMDLRVRVTEDNCRWLVLDELLVESRELYEEIQAFRDKKRRSKVLEKEEKKAKKRKFFGRLNS